MFISCMDNLNCCNIIFKFCVGGLNGRSDGWSDRKMGHDYDATCVAQTDQLRLGELSWPVGLDVTIRCNKAMRITIQI